MDKFNGPIHALWKYDMYIIFIKIYSTVKLLSLKFHLYLESTKQCILVMCIFQIQWNFEILLILQIVGIVHVVAHKQRIIVQI